MITLGTTNLTSLTVNNGVGETTIDMTGYRGRQYDAKVHSGVGDLTMRMRPDSNTRIVMHNGVGDIDTRGILQTDDHYTTAGSNPAPSGK